jgi:UDP-glucose 4-epimerase
VISVLVTGVGTPIGESLVRSLVTDTRVRHVLAVGNSDSFPGADGKRLSYAKVDLRKSRKVHELLFGPARDLGVEVVVHLSQHRGGFDKGERVYAQNVEALRSILDLSNRHPTIRRLIVKSEAVVYKVSLNLPVLVTEDHPLALSGTTPQFVRDRVEADLTACAQMGLIDCEIVVLRCAEALAPDTGSQLYDFLDAPVALRPAGFDPMVNVATIEDIVRAIELATHGSGEGVFNIPGADTLPLSECIRKWGTPGIPLPGEVIRPLYTLRHWVTGSNFSYGINRNRMHLGLILDGTRARNVLGYVPRHPVHWPRTGARTAPSGLDGDHG